MNKTFWLKNMFFSFKFKLFKLFWVFIFTILDFSLKDLIMLIKKTWIYQIKKYIIKNEF